MLPASTELAEGRWDAYVEKPGDEPAEAVVEPGLRDLRALVDRCPDTGTASVSARVPCPTLDGRLAVRSWVRAPHAEAGAVLAGPAGMTVRGVLYGVEAGEGSVVEARLPGARPGAQRPAHRPGPGRTGRVLHLHPALHPAGSRTPARGAALAAVAGPGDGRGRVRISRILDDVWSRDKSFVYPGHPAAPGVRATPCYTTDNDLCLRLEPVPADR